MTTRWSWFFLPALLAASNPARATTVESAAAACAQEPLPDQGPIRYVCDCQAGADPACVAGNDRDTGKTPARAWRSYQKALDAYNTIPAGGTVALCRGGAFSAAGLDTRVANGSCRARRPCVLRDYRPTTWTPRVDRKPIIRGGRNITALQLAEADPDHKEGFRILNLDLEGGRAPHSAGIFIYNDFSDVFICGVTVNEMMDHAVLFGGASDDPPGCYDAGPPVRNRCPLQRRITIQGNRFTNIGEMAFFGYGDDVNLNYNRWENAGATETFDHVVYFGAAEIDHRVPKTQVVLRNEHLIGNEFVDAGFGGRCDGTMVAVHGAHAGLVVQGNVFRFDKHAKGTNCLAVDLTAGTADYPDLFVGALVDANRIEGFGTAGIVISSCQNCTVSNNLIVNDDQSGGSICIGAGAELGEKYDLGGSDDRIVNNTCYLTGRRSGDRGIRIAGQGSGYVLANNVTMFDVAGRGERSACFDHALGAEALVGAAVRPEAAAYRSIRNGGFDIALDGRPHQVTGLDFRSVNSMGDVAVVLAGALAATGLELGATWMGRSFTLNTPPGVKTISVASQPTGRGAPLDVSGTLGLSAVAGAKVTPTYAFADNALCSAASGGAPVWDFATTQSLRAWKASTGRDLASLVGNPLFVNARARGYDFHPLAGSPLIGAGNHTFAPATDIEGLPRAARPDLGAYAHQPPGPGGERGRTR